MAPTAAAENLPRFTLRQIIVGRNDRTVRLPGPWLRAAAVTFPDSLLLRAYRTAARQSGLEPLDSAMLAEERSQHVMGLYRREELLEACHRTLESIRRDIPSDTTRARFDRLFRPRGEWIADLHDAALAWAHQRAPGVTWKTVRPALAATHRIPANANGMDDEATLRALYSLAILAGTDSAGFAGARAALVRADSASAAAVVLLLQGYAEGRRWYTEALDFFLRQPWISGGGSPQSLEALIRNAWGPALGPDFEPELPAVEARWFGYPQAVPRYGVPPALFALVLRPDNPAGMEWLRHQGQAGLLRSLRWLPPGDTALTLLRSGSETLRLTTVSRQSRESLNGFLEPQDVIAIDPGYSPILAVAAVIHEWQHLIFRRRQLETFATAGTGRAPAYIQIPGVQPHLAEGFAEWSAERILAPVAARWPLFTLGELEKLADLAARDGDDQHTVGYALVRALAAALADPNATTAMLLRNIQDPSRIMSEPGPRRAWRKYRRSPDRTLSAPVYPLLVPEVTFTIEDGHPDVIATRILAPADR